MSEWEHPMTLGEIAEDEARIAEDWEVRQQYDCNQGLVLAAIMAVVGGCLLALVANWIIF